MDDTNVTSSLKDKILSLRLKGKTYDEIRAVVGCSKATISYHCARHNMGEQRVFVNDELISQINEYYKSHSLEDVADKFNLSRSTIVKYTENKREKLSAGELKIKNYFRVKSHRQKIKDKAVQHKGGKCVKCGYNRCIRALEFHHIIPSEKDFVISSYSFLSWDRVKKEIEKCMLVCSNCHREIHSEIDNFSGSSPLGSINK
jgi:predicted DNA-binding protein YlxM (UPF0122 family)